MGRLRVKEHALGHEAAKKFIHASRRYPLKTCTYMEGMVASIEHAHNNAVQREMNDKINSIVEIIQGSKFKFQKFAKKVGRP